ncbi:MAG: hypothetical protein B7Y51_10645 [Burkholderiales bacterium 28-67-8]|nr:MAG: hypothetical protein B7Y51_10645 [Burkholderiales bacterium 28-67-8]
MSTVRKAPQTLHQPAASSAVGTLSKSVFALAIEPLTMALTVTGRKAYDVMLWIAQRGPAAADGGYTSPVSAILRGYGSTTKASERVQRYIEQMVQTTVVWRPLAASEQGNMLLEGFEAAAPEKISDEARTFPLLAEARLYIRGGEAWVTWYYPPSIKEQLISPERWAQIELNSIAKLSTYTAVALYEICARYKDSPGGLTSRHEPEFWTRVLREGGGIKPREFRKFKNELLMPAVAEINEETEIEVELIEHREQSTLHAVQFKVARKAKEKAKIPDAADVTLVMRAAKLGVRESDLDALVAKYGALKVTEGLDAMEAYISDPNASKIMNRGGYLKAVLANRFPDGGVPAPLSPAEARPVPKVDPKREQQELVEAWKANRQKQVRAEFSALPDDEKAKWIDQAAPTIMQWSVTTPAMRKRVADRDWESPLISRVVLDVYATARHGAGWKEPSEMDLVMFTVAADRQQA